jgi:hypothetical protein
LTAALTITVDHGVDVQAAGQGRAGRSIGGAQGERAEERRVIERRDAR